MSKPKTAADKQFFKQVCEMHTKVSDQVGQQILQVLDGYPKNSKIDKTAALIGISTALLYRAMFFRNMIKTKPSTKKARAGFVRMAGDCWDDYHRKRSK